MKDALGFLAYLLLPVIGLVTWRLDGVRKLSLDRRLAIAGAAGAVIVGTTMTLMSAAGISWTRTRLLIVFAIVIACGVIPSGARNPLRSGDSSPSLRLGMTLCLLAVFLLSLYGLLTARQTCGDLLYFWGPKGVHFHHAGKIDLLYLGDENYFLAHRDYPPLLPLLFAWSQIVARSFSLWSALLLTLLCVAGAIAVTRADVRSDFTALLAAAVLTYTVADSFSAGAADTPLLFFEAVALGALLYIDDRRAQTIVVALALTAAVLTKVEGVSFVVALAGAMLVHRRPLKQIVAVVVPPLIAVGAWVWTMKRANLLDTYRGAGDFTLMHLGSVLKATLTAGSYHAYWLPWIAPIVVLALGDVRRARLPLTVAALSFGAIIYFYLHGSGDPATFWIPGSAPRVLQTPLVMLLAAASAAHAPATSNP